MIWCDAVNPDTCITFSELFYDSMSRQNSVPQCFYDAYSLSSVEEDPSYWNPGYPRIFHDGLDITVPTVGYSYGNFGELRVNENRGERNDETTARVEEEEELINNQSGLRSGVEEEDSIRGLTPHHEDFFLFSRVAGEMELHALHEVGFTKQVGNVNIYDERPTGEFIYINASGHLDAKFISKHWKLPGTTYSKLWETSLISVIQDQLTSGKIDEMNLKTMMAAINVCILFREADQACYGPPSTPAQKKIRETHLHEINSRRACVDYIKCLLLSAGVSRGISSDHLGTMRSRIQQIIHFFEPSGLPMRVPTHWRQKVPTATLKSKLKALLENEC